MILEWPAFEALARRLEAAGAEWLHRPRVRFEGQTGEQATLFVRDPAGNALEFKAFRDGDQVFATDAAPEVIDVTSGGAWPASELSNFAAHPFRLDGIQCASMEGLLQSLKIPDPALQIEICALVGGEAKSRGTDAWRATQTLWWRETPMGRSSAAYQALLDRAFEALSTDHRFQQALLATGHATLIHTPGEGRGPSETCLTNEEFLSRLTLLRARLQLGQG